MLAYGGIKNEMAPSPPAILSKVNIKCENISAFWETALEAVIFSPAICNDRVTPSNYAPMQNFNSFYCCAKQIWFQERKRVVDANKTPSFLLAEVQFYCILALKNLSWKIIYLNKKESHTTNWFQTWLWNTWYPFAMETTNFLHAFT